MPWCSAEWEPVEVRGAARLQPSFGLRFVRFAAAELVAAVFVGQLGACTGAAGRALADGDAAGPRGSARACGPPASAGVVPTTLLDAEAFAVQALPGNVTAGALTNGCLVLEDVDGDGFDDLLVANSHEMGRVELSAAWGPLSRDAFEWTALATLDVEGLFEVGACALADVDGDGDLDLAVGGTGRVDVLEQTGPREFALHGEVVDFPAEMPENALARVIVPLPGRTAGTQLLAVGTAGVFPPCSFVEHHMRIMHRDGDVQWHFDAMFPQGVLGCFAQTDSFRWESAPPGACPPLRSGQWLSAAMGDLDGDALPEVIFTRDFAPNVVWGLMPDGSWVEESPAPLPLPHNHGMGVAITDIDGDGCVDVYVADFGVDQLYLSKAGGGFDDVSTQGAVGLNAVTRNTVSWGIVVDDFDLNGIRDLFVGISLVGVDLTMPPSKRGHHGCDPIGGQDWNALAVQVAPRRFAGLPLAHETSYQPTVDQVTVVSGDPDEDGALDVVTLEQGTIRIHWNVAHRAGHWLEVRVLDSRGLPSVGAHVRVVAPDGLERNRWLWGQYGTSGHSELVAHFGLGSEVGPVRIEVTWPDGAATVLDDQPVDRRVVVHKP